jgi:hypothetical protein
VKPSLAERKLVFGQRLYEEFVRDRESGTELAQWNFLLKKIRCEYGGEIRCNLLI